MIVVKRGLRNSTLLPTLTYGSEKWMWNRAQQSRVHAVKMSYLRAVCGVTTWDGQSKSMYEWGGMGTHANRGNCGVVERVKINTLRWFGHNEKMESEEFVKKVYVSKSVGPNSRGRLPQRWNDRVKDYKCERGAPGFDQGRKEGLDKDRWRLFCLGQSLGVCC